MAWDRSGKIKPGNDGVLYLVYTDVTAGAKPHADIMVAVSDDSGNTWSAVTKVNDDATTNDQFMAAIAVDQTSGAVAATWYDARDDNNNKKVHIYSTAANELNANKSPKWQQNKKISAGASDAKAAEDYGKGTATGGTATTLKAEMDRSWSMGYWVGQKVVATTNGNTKIATITENGKDNITVGGGETINATNGTTYQLGDTYKFDFGDYIGLAFHDNKLFPLWADNSNSTKDNSDGALRSLDLYTTKITAVLKPKAKDDQWGLLPDEPFTVPAPGVLANDINPAGLPMTVHLVTDPENGTLDLHADGSFEYTPDPGFLDRDSFTYYFTTPNEASNVATVWLDVSDVPVAHDDQYTVVHDSELVIVAPGVLENDTSPTGSALTAILDTDSANGTVALNADGSFTYTPDAGFVGTDSFTYKAYDGYQVSNPVTVTITVIGTKVGDQVWHDVNANGIQDEGEEGLASKTVNLLDEFGNWLASTTTDTDGHYEFTGFDPGNYRIQVLLPPYYFFSPRDMGDDDALDSDVNVDGVTAVFSLAAGEHRTDIDAGLLVTDWAPSGGRIGDFVWHDLDADGLQDVGEPGLSGVAVHLRDAFGTLLDSTTTDSTGFFEFLDLDEGNYSLWFEPPSGHTFTLANQGADEAIDSDADASGVTPVLSLNYGNERPDVDAGLILTGSGGSGGSVGDFVWHDDDGDGIQDLGESSAIDVTVNLLDGLGGWLASTTTDANGRYEFRGLAPGNYRLRFDALPDYEFTLQDQGADTQDSDADSSGATAVFSLSFNEARTDLDAGLVYSGDSGGSGGGTASVGDFVWDDQNRNGLQDGNEPGLAGMVVHLLDGQGGWLASTTTNVNGYYEFSELAPGYYRLQFVSTAFWHYTANEQGSDDGIDSDALFNGYTDVFELAPWEVAVGMDAGFYLDDGGDSDTASVGDRVWHDADGDGVQDAGEDGVAGVTVELLDEFGFLLASLTTDADGQFLFIGLAQGTYRLRFVAPTGYQFTDQNQGGDDARDSDAGVDGLTGVFALNFGEDRIDVDADLIYAE